MARRVSQFNLGGIHLLLLYIFLERERVGGLEVLDAVLDFALSQSDHNISLSVHTNADSPHGLLMMPLCVTIKEAFFGFLRAWLFHRRNRSESRMRRPILDILCRS